MADDLDRLDKLAEAATPGPWSGGVCRAYRDEDGKRRGAGSVRREGGAIVFMSANGPEILEDDVKFIAAANPKVVRALVQRVRDAVAEAARLGSVESLFMGEQERADRAEAERYTALAAIERVREALSLHNPNGRLVKEVLAALDRAPEPDREAQLERVAARLREIVYLCGDDLGCQCEEAQDASADLARELSIIAAERPTLTADEVWAIAKAEHDFAGDSDNVGAFVDSLTDALRTAGVAFDEQPFIGSGYLLPAEGEKP